MIIMITRVKMYVCFGFSLARLRRARKIDLQCQSLSPSSFFDSQHVSVMYACFSLTHSLMSSKDDRPVMSVVLSPLSFFASQRVSVGAPDRQELCHSLASSLAKSIENHRKHPAKIDAGRSPGPPKIDSKSLPGPSRDTP